MATVARTYRHIFLLLFILLNCEFAFTQRVNSSSLVSIHGYSYSVDKIPPKESALVQESKRRLLGVVDLGQLVSDLGLVGKCVRVAYNGVAGNTELQLEIQDIGYKVTKLFDKSAISLNKFSTTSRYVLDQLMFSYGYLQEGLEELALQDYAEIGGIAKVMAKAADDLHQDFEDAAESVKQTLEKTQRHKGTQEENRKKMQADKHHFEMKREIAAKLTDEAMKAEERAESLYREARSREDDILAKENSVPRQILKTVVNTVSTFLFRTSIIEESMTTQEVLKSAQEEKMKHYEQMQKQQQLRLDAMQDIASFTSKIANCKTDDEIAEVTIGSLHYAISGLKTLSDIMMQTATYWNQIQEHCDSVAGSNLKTHIEKALMASDVSRHDIWSSDTLKIQMIHEYSRWVALDDVSSTVKDRIKLTQSELHSYIRENPTIEESRQNIRQLAKELDDDIEQAKSKIKEEQRETKRRQIESARDEL